MAGGRERPRGRGDHALRHPRSSSRPERARQCGPRAEGGATEVSGGNEVHHDRRDRAQASRRGDQGRLDRRGQGQGHLRVDRREHLPGPQGTRLRAGRHQGPARDRLSRGQVRGPQRALRRHDAIGRRSRPRHLRRARGRLRRVQEPGQERRHHQGPALPGGVLLGEPRLGSRGPCGRAQARPRGERRDAPDGSQGAQGARQALRVF